MSGADRVPRLPSYRERGILPAQRALEARTATLGMAVGMKPDWSTYLHTLRRREIDLVFGHCPPALFDRGLELGAGDGFQSRLLAHYVADLVVSDYRPSLANLPARPGMTYQMCDAERVDEVFAAQQFDLIFSSNMLEHLPQPERALRGMQRVLKDDGVTIHLIPSPFWKLCQMIGFFPNAVISRLERWRQRRNAASAGKIEQAAEIAWDNNPKVAGRQYSYLRRLLWPTPHGVSGSNRAEFTAFSPARWRSMFARADFEVAAVLRGPVSSGYGFGLDGLRTRLERLGLASEYAYIAHKAGRPSPYLIHF